MARINKARYWTGVLWLENLDENWQDEIADLAQVPFAYCVHDKDVDEQNEGRKPYVHLILVSSQIRLPYNHAFKLQVAWDKAKLIQSRLALVHQKHL